MVNNNAQLFTIEGIAASLMILVTTYFIIGGSTVVTPGETHTADMQLEQLAVDILTVMDTPVKYDYSILSDPSTNEERRILTLTSDLESIVRLRETETGPDPDLFIACIRFRTLINEYLNKNIGTTSDNRKINYCARMWDSDGNSWDLSKKQLSPDEHVNAVRATRLVLIYSDLNSKYQERLVELYLWRE